MRTDVRDATLGKLAWSRPSHADAALWAGRIGASGAAFAAGSGLARAADPLLLVVALVLGVLAVSCAVAQPRWCLVAALFLLVGYVPDLLATRSASHALIVIVLTGAVVRWATGRERFALPGEMVAFGALLLAFVTATLLAADTAVAASETLDLVSYAAVVAMLMVLLDATLWLRRAVWAVVIGIGLLAALAIVQQVTKSYASTYGGFATILPAGDAMRSAGPLNPNPFGQVVATAAVLAFYLARTPGRRTARWLAAAIATACVVAVVYSQSRAALIALLIVAFAIGALRGVRLRVLAVAVCGVIVLGPLVLPASLQTRVDALYTAVSANAGTPQDTSLRGRKSENLAGLRMWADHPLVGVGPDNFEIHYEQYSEAIGTDPRPEERGAHNLYLESFAETGILGASAFIGVLWLALAGAWRARRRLQGGDALLAEGILVALCAFLICAVTLHSAYARYQWIFIGLGLAAGRLARRQAR
jgi:putative inorganic carbon (HCO3(-)) transporter